MWAYSGEVRGDNSPPYATAPSQYPQGGSDQASPIDQGVVICLLGSTYFTVLDILYTYSFFFLIFWVYYHPIWHYKFVVSTLLHRTQNIPSTQKGKHEETKWLKIVLRDNNYPSSFINNCEISLSKLNRPIALWYYPMCRAFRKGLVEFWGSNKSKSSSNNREQFVSSTESPGKEWQVAIWHIGQNQLHQQQFCTLRSNWTILKTQNTKGTQKGYFSVTRLQDFLPCRRKQPQNSFWRCQSCWTWG